jgi:hypothetical protein
VVGNATDLGSMRIVKFYRERALQQISHAV